MNLRRNIKENIKKELALMTEQTMPVPGAISPSPNPQNARLVSWEYCDQSLMNWVAGPNSGTNAGMFFGGGIPGEGELTNDNGTPPTSNGPNDQTFTQCISLGGGNIPNMGDGFKTAEVGVTTPYVLRDARVTSVGTCTNAWGGNTLDLPYACGTTAPPSRKDDCCDWCQTGPFIGDPPPGCKDWMCTDSQWISDNCSVVIPKGNTDTLQKRIKEELENYDDTVTQVEFQDELIQLSSQDRDMVRDMLEDSLDDKKKLEEAFAYKGIPELKADGFLGKMMKYFKRFFTDKAATFLINASAEETKDTIELIKVMDPNDMTGVFDPRAMYLGGAIDFATDALGWRTQMEKYFGENHVVKDERLAKLVLTGEWDTKGISEPAILNPLRAETVREEDEEFNDLFGKWKSDSLKDDEMQTFREKIRQNIILQDLRMLDICDTNLLRYDGKAGAGTLGEAQLSALKNQQLFLWVTDGMKISNVSPWLLPAVTKICIDDEIWELLKHFK